MLKPGSVTTKEVIIRETYQASGSRVKQMTSAPAIHTNIYGEVPYMDPSSRWFIFTKSRDSYGPLEVWRADLERDWLTPVCDGVSGIGGMAVSPDQRYFYCVRKLSAEDFEIVRTDIETLAQESVAFHGAPYVRSLGAVAPDNRTYISSTVLGKQRYGIVRYDLQTGQRDVIHEGSDICNAHPQIEPGVGEDYLIQHNRGCEFDEQGRCLRLVGDMGATLYLIDKNGHNYRELPVGKPHTWPVQGHQCWIGTTGDILLTVSGRQRDEAIERGILMTIHPGDEEAKVVANGYLYSHPNASRDGRFFVSDTSGDGLIVVGSIKTGKKRVLCESLSSFSSPQYTHPHPYFSPDRRWVIFNSDRTGIPHVFAASVPDGLLEELEDD